MTDDPSPVHASSAGCAIGVRRPAGQWTPCPGEVTHAALWVEHPDKEKAPQHPGVNDQVGSPLHKRQQRKSTARRAYHPALTDARPLTGADREALGMRRRNRAAALAGQPWTPPKPLA